LKIRQLVNSVLWLALVGIVFPQSLEPEVELYTLPAGFVPYSPFVVSAFPEIPQPMGVYIDTLRTPKGWLDVTYGRRVIDLTIAPDWSMITFSETIDDRILRIPFTAPLDWYFNKSLKINRHLKFINNVAFNVQRQHDERSQRSNTLEVVGVDLGRLGRASLRVRGNVNISGKMVFQDQELVRSSISETQNTHIEFDQKQNLSIEGKIGDRITVSMDQDSERDFDWENNIRIQYEGKEDEILQSFEAGNISLSLPSTQYVTFSGNNQGLFGLKAISKLGPIDITTIASVEQTKKEQQKWSGDGQEETQRIEDYQYIKNQYFFIHEWYRNGVNSGEIDFPSQTPFNINPYYPLNEEGKHPPLSENRLVVKNFELYKFDQSNNPAADEGTAYAGNPPSDIGEWTDPNPNYNKPGSYLKLERNSDYLLNEDLGYIRMKTRGQNDILACHYSLVNFTTGDTIMTVGHGITDSDSVLVLKMLKPQNNSPSHPVWDLMFKNVYYLGASNINSEGFAVRLMYNLDSPIQDRNINGAYITQFGLDIEDENSNPQPDELVDYKNGSIVNLQYGELHFPALHPFASVDSLEGGTTNELLNEYLGSGSMYQTSNQTTIRGDSRFTIEVDYTNVSSTINLGFMLVEGSEEVYVNNSKQVRGTDYQIDNFSGTIVFLNEIDPKADVEIKYDKHELVSFDKKVILGSRAQMDLGKNSFIGATALYYNQSIINEKIEVGYEPTRNFIWDLNGRYEWDLEKITRTINKIPTVNTEQMSSFSIEGEIAQVLPNPNPINNEETGDPNGVAYIDDFEGSKKTTSPPIQRRYWKSSSAPLDPMTLEPLSQLNRARMYWYNPYTQVRTKDIWPNQSTSVRAQNETTDILVMHHKKRTHQDEMGVDDDQVWSGLTTALYSGDYDQTSSKFFEIWLKGTEGKIEIDLGKISEDQNADGRLNTEDKPESGMTLGNGFLEDDEDTGVDGCFDEFEDGWGGCLDSLSYADYVVLGDNETINMSPDVDPDDPNGDNWMYNEGSADYSHVNGTEGNGTGTKIQEGGKYPDTEDLDRSGSIDKISDYFTKGFSIDPYHTDAEKYLAGETINDGEPTGWRLYRIPLSHFALADTSVSGGMVNDWTEIRNLRLIWSGVEDGDAHLSIAKMEIVGNYWTELGVADSGSVNYVKDDSVFAVTVINTEDNADVYTPPKGVEGEYDRINEIRSKEQSLVLKFDKLGPGEKAAAHNTEMSFSGDRAKSFLIYDRLKMYIFGSSEDIGIQDSDVEFFMQFGKGDNYYEVVQPVFNGWDEENGRNSIDLDLNWLTKLKLQTEENVTKFRPSDEFIDSTYVKIYHFTDSDSQRTGKTIRIQGQPAINRLQYINVGIRNISDREVTGEVWLDELRLSGVKKDRGVAMRLVSKFNLADLGNTTVSYSRKDADFHVLQQRLGSNQTSEDLRVNTSLQLHKLLPKWVGISIPLSTSFSNTVSRPKYFPDTDILAGDAPPDSILTKSQSISLSTNVKKAVPSENPFVKYTLDNLQASFSASKSKKSNPLFPKDNSESYSGKLSYTVSFGKGHYFSPLKWMQNVPWIGSSLSEFHIYYLPKGVNTSIDFSEKLNQKQPRIGNPPPDYYNLGLNRKFNLDYKILESVTTKYGYTSQSDMKDYRGYAWMAIRDLDPGVITKTSENTTTSFTPTLFEWLKPTFNYSSNYSWSQGVGQESDGASIGSQLSLSTNVSFSFTNIFELVYKPQTESRSTRERSRRGRNTSDNDTALEQKVSEKKSTPILTYIHTFTKKIDPISFTYKETRNRMGYGVLGDVPVGYKFGWLGDHGLEHSNSVGSNIGNWDKKQDITLRSGLKPFKRISISLNYAQNVSMSRGGTGVESRSIVRDYFSFGEKMEKGFPFFGWSLRMSGLENLPLLKSIARTVSLEHAYSGKQSMAWKFEGVNVMDIGFFDINSFIDMYGTFQTQSTRNTNFSPLVGLTMSLNKGISVTIRQNFSRSVDETQTGMTVKTDKSLNASIGYNLKGGFKIPLPIIKNWEVDNSMGFTLNLDMNESRTMGTKDKTTLSEQAFNSGWKIGARVSYSFTSKVSGGVRYEYRENDSKTNGRKVDRDFGFDINIAISG